MGNIVLLDDLTINKIAAGEVVDRPASIVKELIENSIDAKATAVTVEIKNGGITFLKITDNGTGIKSDDVELAFERHATSKIRKEEDITNVLSMGFRGEALASICAIANVEVLTKHRDENTGTKVVVEAGKIISSEIAPATAGTTITVRNVFFNVPARFKFLKKDTTEGGYIEDVVTRLAIVHPDISFKYISNGKVIIQTAGNGDLSSVCYSIFGKEVASNIIDVNYSYEGINITGVIGNSNISRATRTNQFFYVNDRYIKDKILQSSITEAYKQMLAIGKFAFCILNIHMSPSLVDVNVHPAKLEVKFSDEQMIFKAVYGAVKNSLLSYNQKTSPFTINSDERKNTLSSSFKFSNTEKKAYDNMNLFVNKESDIKESSNITKAVKEEIKTDLVSSPKYELKQVVENSVVTVQENISNVDEYKIQEDVAIKEDTVSKENKMEEKPSYKYIGTVFDTYIIIQISDKMYIIDQHAAHERIIYERIKDSYYSIDKQTQMLLLPILINLTNKESEVFKENKSYFDNAGFITDMFGENSIKISGVPDINYDIDYKEMFMDTLDEILGATRVPKEEKESRFLYTVACKAAVKANMCLDQKECISLIEDMMCLDRPFTCPHGRPTAYEISKYEIERKFLRK